MKKFNNIGIVGAGAWGSALAISLAKTHKQVLIWAKEKEVVDSINNHGRNNLFLPDADMPANLKATNILSDIEQCDILLLVTPAQFTRSIIQQIKFNNNVPFIICSKGIEESTLKLQSEVLEDIARNHPIAIASGPTFADEVANLAPSSMNIACRDFHLAENIQHLFERTNITIHIIEDIIGAQIAGSVKNVIAIGCGIANGLGCKDNIHASIITKGLKEAAILTMAKGGKKETLLELCGVGDMVLTCSSRKSRNMDFGYNIGKGKTVKLLLDRQKKIVEGAATVKSIYAMSQKHNIELDLCNAIYRIIYSGSDAKEILKHL